MTQRTTVPFEPTGDNAKDFDWLTGGGEMGKLIRTIDWSQTALGLAEFWPQSLKTTMSICLSSTFPTSIVWGPSMVQIYNDSYRPICGDAHPKSLGAKFWDTWESARPAVGAIIEKATGGEGSYLENLRMFLERKGYIEEAFMTFSFSPISDEKGEVGGLFHPITETTERMLQTRRTQLLRELAVRLSEAKNLSEIFDLAGQHFENYTADLPYLAFYEWQNALALTRASYGITFQYTANIQEGSQEGDPGLGLLVDPLQKELRTIAHKDFKFSEDPIAPYPELPVGAMILPLVLPGMPKALGFAVAGISSRRALDDAYRVFYDDLAQALNKAIANVHAFEQEQKRAAALAEIDKAKTHFFSNISHELRTPLTLMLGPIEDQLIKEGLPKEVREVLELVYRNGKRLRKLVNSLLDFSRIEAGRLKPNFVLIDVARETRDLVGIFRSTIEKAGLELRVDPLSLSEAVYIDPEMWERVILNLLSNAYKYTLKGSVDVGFRESEDSVYVVVSDSGIGIPKADIPKLFDRFHRVEGAHGRTYEGTGIGLSLVQQLMKIQGGGIEVSSTEGQGTQFTIWLKKGTDHINREQIHETYETRHFSSDSMLYLEEIDSWRPADPKDKNGASTNHELRPLIDATITANGSAYDRQTILIVDDNADMRDYIANFLGKSFDLILADNGDTAWEIVHQQNVNLVLSDVMMPGLNGFELLRSIRSDKTIGNLPVILLSAQAGEEAKIEGLREGANDYLVKPFSSRELIARVHSTLQISKMQLETALLRHNRDERLRSTFAHAAVGLALLDLDFKVIEANSIFAEITGYAIEELQGLSIDRLNKEDDLRLVMDKIKQMLAGWFNGFVQEKQLIRKDGSLCWVQNSISAARSVTGDIDSIIIVTEDIQLRKESETLVIGALEEAKGANRAKSMFLANMSHEIRTPLGIIKGYVDLLSESHALPSEQESWLDIVGRNTQQLAIIIDDILDLSRVEADKVELHNSWFDLYELLSDVETTFEHRAEGKDIIIYYDVWQSRSRKIFCDRSRLRQILVNVIGNSIKFTERGRIDIIYNCHKISESEERHVFTVKDTGIGMSESDRRKIFQPFTQADSAINRRFGGTGLGLALSRNFARMMGGDLDVVQSALGEGSTVALQLDLLRHEDIAQVIDREPATPADPLPLKGLEILLVEDSFDNQMLLSLILKKVGVESIIVVSNGYEGIEAATARSFDIILMDVQMPLMDGFEAVRILRGQNYRKPIIALTAHAMSDYRKECLEAGFDDYLTKPIDRKELIAAILRGG